MKGRPLEHTTAPVFLVATLVATLTATIRNSTMVILRLAALLLALWAMPATAGQIFVSNAATGTVGEYTTAGATINASLLSGLNSPAGIVVSGSNLFVANYDTGTIGKYTTSGATINANLVTGLNGPLGIALSGGRLFVVNNGSNTIGEYDADTGAVVNASLISGFVGLHSLYAIAASGTDLFVTNLANPGTIGKYTTGGAVVNVALVSGVGNAFGIAVSGSNLFVTSGEGTIGQYTTAGATVNPALVTGFRDGFGIAVSGSDLFVTDRINNLIGAYTASGATINTELVSGLHTPSFITVVPEPSTGGTLLMGAGAVLFFCRRRRKATWRNEPHLELSYVGGLLTRGGPEAEQVKLGPSAANW
jgi:PEP-CTERM motif-containing protein